MKISKRINDIIEELKNIGKEAIKKILDEIMEED